MCGADQRYSGKGSTWNNRKGFIEYLKKWNQESFLKLKEFEKVKLEKKSDGGKGSCDPNMQVKYLKYCNERICNTVNYSLRQLEVRFGVIYN